MIVKQCKVHGGLTESQIYKNRKCIVCCKEYTAKYQALHPEKVKLACKAWKKNNGKKIKEYRDKFNTENNERKVLHDKVACKKYYRNNREKINKKTSELIKKKTIELHDSYVKAKLARQYNMKTKDVPQWMVELKKPLLMIKREIRKKNENN